MLPDKLHSTREKTTSGIVRTLLSKRLPWGFLPNWMALEKQEAKNNEKWKSDMLGGGG